jgi:hypothetical protein
MEILKSLPKMISAIIREKKNGRRIVDQDIDGIISDNRLGVLSKKVPTVL